MPQYFFYQNPDAKINTQINLNDEQKFWQKHSYERFQLMKHSRQSNGREDKWNQWQKQYEAWRPPRSQDDWQSNIVPPFTTSVVESALSEIVDQTLQPQVGARKREYVPHATVVNHIKDYTWEMGYGDVELYKSLKQLLILGTTVWQEYYYQDKRKVQQIVDYDPKTGREKYKEVEIYDYDDCFGETVSLWDVWFDPAARTVNMGPYKAQDAIRRYIMHIDTFRNTFKGTKWDKFGLVNKVQPGGDTNYYQFYQPPKGIDHESYVEVLWHWIRNPDRLVLLANDIPFYIGPNPYNHKQLPFAIGYDIMDPFSIYGKGEPALLESIQDELTTTRRIRLDRSKLDVFKMVFVGNNETVEDQDLIPAPMKPVRVRDVNNIKAFEYGDINQSAYREEQLLKEDGVRVTGIDDRFQSVQKQGATATEAAILKESTMKRLRNKIWLNSRTLLMDIARLRVPNILQFYKTPKVVEIMGDSAIEKMMRIRELAYEGRLLRNNNKYYEVEYRTIVSRNKQLKRNQEGGVDVIDKRGDNFFMVTPDLLPPSASVFNYKLSAEPTFPLSKPLMQQKINELFQHPIIMSAVQMGYYDPTKIADKMTELNDFDPEDFKGQTKDNSVARTLIDPQMMIEYANRENEMMLKGEEVVGTPFATMDHTMIHIAFMKSEVFKKQATPEIISIFAKHIMEEHTAQNMRGQALNALPDQQAMALPSPVGQDMRGREIDGIMSGDMKALMPSRAVGAENVPDVTGAMMR